MGLGILYKKEGLTTRAKRQFEKALDIESNHQAARQELESMGEKSEEKKGKSLFSADLFGSRKKNSRRPAGSEPAHSCQQAARSLSVRTGTPSLRAFSSFDPARLRRPDRSSFSKPNPSLPLGRLRAARASSG